jgi:hypothetical protein
MTGNFRAPGAGANRTAREANRSLASGSRSKRATTRRSFFGGGCK